MKKLKLFLIVFISFNVYSQNKIEYLNDGFIISLQEKKYSFLINKEGNYNIVDYYEFTDLSKSNYYKLPYQTLFISIPFNSKPHFEVVAYDINKLNNSIPSLNPSLEKLNDSTLIQKENKIYTLQKEIKSKNIVDILGYGWYKGNYSAVVQVNTHDFDPNEMSIIERRNIKIKVKLENSINYSDAKVNDDNLIVNQFTNQNFIKNNFFLSDTTGSWINYNLKYIKIGTWEDGIYKIDKKYFDNAGINISNIIPKTLRLFESGKEIPIYFSGNNENVFNENDFILFYGKKNYSKKNYRVNNYLNEEYREYLNRFTDTTIYFLTWGGENGKRIEKSNLSTTTNDDINYYKSLTHVEENRILFFANTDELHNQLPSYNGNKTWYFHQSRWLYSGGTLNYSFNAQDLISNKEAYFYFKGVSGGSNLINNAHNLSLKVNNILLDSTVINRHQQVLLKGKINTNQLKQTSNSFVVRNYNNGTSVNTIAVDWYEVEYPKKLKLENDQLIFEIYNDVEPSLKAIKIENANLQDYFILKVNDNQKLFANYSIENKILTFIDSVKAGDLYAIFNKEKIIYPKLYYSKQFLNLRTQKNQLDYLAITHSNFNNSVKNYVNEISKNYNVKSEVFNIDDIYDEFSFGYPEPYAIRLFLFTTYNNRENPKPTYAVIIGDANYDYKDNLYKANGVKLSYNFIPSYGYPVSDNWFAIWDNLITVPQLRIGRIPIKDISELDYYLSKVKNTVNSKYDDFNKRYLFFSGGPSNDVNQINSLKNVNDYVIKNLIEPLPIAGYYTHFYKTVNPQTDFGPYTPNEISEQIKKGGLFISYLGHSGTATWDNSINDPSQLLNTKNKNPLITDFGCSTNKFAEPDIVCFGENFLLGKNGQAIAYIGNSSLGFTSTAYSVPKYFYESLINSSKYEVGEALNKSKELMLKNLGITSTTTIFNFTNSLLGDPIVRIPIPQKPNLVISLSDLKVDDKITSDVDSLKLILTINNFGLATNDSLSINVLHFYENKTQTNFIKRIKVPPQNYIYFFNLNVKNKPGEHLIKIFVDSNNEIEEIYEDDNILTYQFKVFSSDLRDLLITQNENSLRDSIVIINPVVTTENKLAVVYQFSNDSTFTNYNEGKLNLDTIRTTIKIPDSNAKRLWFRYKLDLPNAQFSIPKSFKNFKKNKIIIDDQISFNNLSFINTSVDNNEIQISKKEIKIAVTSAGWYAGSTCVIAKDGINQLTNTFFAGMGIVVFNPITFDVEISEWYNLFLNQDNIKKLANLINSIPNGKIVAIGVSDDAANNITAELKNAIKTLGSTKIDNLQFRGSWALIGKKGGNPDEIFEVVKGPYEGLIYIEKLYNAQQTNGLVETKFFGPVESWEKIEIGKELINDSKIKVNVIGKDVNDNIVNLISSESDEINISNINAKNYPFIKIQAELISDSIFNSPKLKSISIDFKELPELAINYQTVSISKDSIELGENISSLIKLFNIGESTARNFNVVVEVEKNGNNEILYHTKIDSLKTNSNYLIKINYKPTNSSGNYYFKIYIDPENKIRELYKDNNNFKIPFFVKKNTKQAKINLTIDGYDIFDGEYVSSNPNIQIKLLDESLFPITDTSKIDIYLNGKRISYKSDKINVAYSNENPKVIVDYKPILNDGEYVLKIIGRNSTNEIIDSTGIVKKFFVNSTTNLLNVYNYPNPMKNETNFTFKLTTLPDELKIIIYTIAGRKIKEFNFRQNQLKYDFNSVYWDGKDEDGNNISNGVYIYKIILKQNDKVVSNIGKFAKVE